MQDCVIVLENARLLCPASGRDETGAVLMENGVITDVGPRAGAGSRAVARADCQGHLLIPGIVDAQVWTGEPGEEYRETLASASRAAAAGGVTTIIVQPDTNPVIDDVAIVDFIQRAARAAAIVNVHPMAALTKGLAGVEMAEIYLLKAAGAVAFTNGRRSIADAQLMRQLLAYTRDLDAVVMHFPEDNCLARGGVMNEGAVSSRLGMPGVPAEAETIVLERDVRLAALTGGRYHASGISCEASLAVIRAAKARGLRVTCAANINNLTMTEEAVTGYRTFCKVKPPLRTEDERRAMVRGVARGEIDIVVSCHDPQDVETKRLPFEEAAYGALGLETLLPAALELHHRSEIELTPLIAAMTASPAALFGLASGRLVPGARADLTLVNLDAPWTVDAKKLRSRCKNSLFDEYVFRSRVLHTYVGGKQVYGDPEFAAC